MFDTEHARLYGLEEAVLINNLKFWIVRNRANGENFREDRTWSYNSINAFSEQFPYLSRDRIRRTLASLMKQGVIQSGNFNERATDRTLWYAFVDEEAFLQDVPELAKSQNGKGKSANAHVAKSPNAGGDSAASLTTTDVNANKKADSGRGTRLTKDWELSAEAIQRTVAVTETYAANLDEWAGGAWSIQHVIFEAEKFRDYWTAKSGKDATKTDWPATWRNWVRNAGPMRAARKGGAGGGNWRASDEAALAKANEVGVGRAHPSESRDAWHARIQAAIENGGAPPVPRPQAVTPLDPIPVPGPVPPADAPRTGPSDASRSAMAGVKDLLKKQSFGGAPA
ncbi:hypothetical protein LA345_38825 (plasmid) [Burkholderia vietnamiensis]|nr:hypothetical protein [Burkholderia vietnamiensis]